jgi:anti-anti-sigma factor
MEIKTEKLSSVFVVYVNGRLDSLTSPQLESGILPYVGVEPKIILDLSDVDYVSSAGLRVFLMIAKTANRNQSQFVLCNVTKDILDIIEMSGFSVILNIKTTLQEAIGPSAA